MDTRTENMIERQPALSAERQAAHEAWAWQEISAYARLRDGDSYGPEHAHQWRDMASRLEYALKMVMTGAGR